jgi:hypothetical protein
MPSLVDPYLKSDWAGKHLQALRDKVRLYCAEPDVCTLVGEEDFKNQRYIVHIKVKPIPDPIPLVLGDFLGCLRSSLDQVVWSLARLTLPNPKHTQFPIIEKWNSDGRKRFDAQTLGVCTKAKGIIKGFQPDQGGDAAALRSHQLWFLNEMCIIDKHMRIPARGGGFDIAIPQGLDPALIDLDETGIISGPLSLKDKMAFEPPHSFKVIFGDPDSGIECDMDRLGAIHDFVANKVIPRFAGFFS